MNRNLGATTTLVRQVLAGGGPDIAAAIAHALNGAGLLVDPERTYGTVLRKTPSGWALVAPATGWAASLPAPDAPPVTELEREASAWDQACERAQALATATAMKYAAEPEVTRVTADRDTVVISLHIVERDRWTGWMAALGIAPDQVTVSEYVVHGRTSWDGVPVSVLAYDMPELQAATAASLLANRPYRYAGVVYDLALEQQDINGDRWFYHGEETAERMPLLSQDGRPERCTLANIVELVGPLTPVRELATTTDGAR
ncbi:BN159_2729 family protein [Streptomyces sp. AM 2-1-1]|uniref:BN159_2729 family protein n=1 Tax=Streptomyces sp. AM 2-1-1 TaxID=3028709 RepID=UPI0023B8FD38|nr:BN159_2729 family protein [Streptomyces sp. AM 2-1-1]WEH40753.1 BN159_2729 family protein [Streptomyces sp. AM 2-1-1]